jgi:hypothetical protein
MTPDLDTKLTDLGWPTSRLTGLIREVGRRRGLDYFDTRQAMTLADLLAFTRYELLGLRRMGETTVRDLEARLAQLGLALPAESQVELKCDGELSTIPAELMRRAFTEWSAA